MDKRLFFKATERNRVCIGDALSEILPKEGTILEIASGSGEHGVTFQERFPSIIWQASDPEVEYRDSISAWIKYKNLSTKMPTPIRIDVREKPWPLTTELKASLKVIVCINMLHITPWECTKSLFEEAKNYLKKDYLLILYGPFKKNGKHTSESNRLFNESLKSQNESWGVRDLSEVIKIGSKNGFKNQAVMQMPANNLLIVFRSTGFFC